MGCKCKRVKKLYNNLTGEERQTSILGRFFQGIILLAVLLVVLPFVALYLSIHYIIKGNFTIKIPNFTSKKNG